MLQKLVKAAGGSSQPTRAAPLSIIAPDVRIVGDIVAQGEIHIDGQVDGDITCETLVVGEGARISGEVTAERVKVHGELTGKINSTAISIARSAQVIGDMTHESLEIEAGAHVEGHCIRKVTLPPSEPKRLEASPAVQQSGAPQGGGRPSKEKAAAEAQGAG